MVDQWSTLQASGLPNSIGRSFPGVGTYSVKVKAQDSLGAESGWSAGRTIVIATPSSNLSAAVTVSPATVLVGGSITVTLTVNNNGTANATGMTPSIGITGSAIFSGTPISVSVAPATVNAGNSRTFSWTFSATGSGDVTFTAWADGTDAGTGLSLHTSALAVAKVATAASGKVGKGKLIIAPNSIDPTKPGSKIVFHFKGDAGSEVEAMIFTANGHYIGSLKGTIDYNGAGTITLTDAKVDGKPLATGFYWAQIKGGGVSDRKQFAVVSKKGK